MGLVMTDGMDRALETGTQDIAGPAAGAAGDAYCLTPGEPW